MDARTPGELNGGDPLAVSRPISILINSVSLNEDCIPAERTAQAKMQSVFQQVRKQVTSQGGAGSSRNSILELVQMVKRRELEMMTVMNVPKDTEKVDAETLGSECTGEKNARKEDLLAVFQREMEASKDALRDEFKEQIAQLRIEMQEYTNKALKGLESKAKNRKTSSKSLQRIYHVEQSDTRGFEKNKKSPVTPFLGPGKTRVLTRTMTTLNPKTCPPIVLGPRSKSETLSTSRDSSGLLKDPDFLPSRTSKYLQPCGPLPPTCPPHYNQKKTSRTKAQTGNANNS
ncbi:hypothetical protein DPEC_G00262690 [Dallia pectoralis]|uniref:Uncharacterized protein n=1 Tax=Dallia pectoralis TaxID=75939 RepID=A0ACC2FS59_DALPE|nr:hypothetical protein DPEC_G00262690 [Dallia pectoralis]